jgi:hypothetical protein
MAHDLGTDLNELLLQARPQPVLDRLRRRHCPQESAEIVGKCVELKANGVGGAANVLGTQSSAFQITELIVHEQLIIAGTGVVAVPDAHLLFAVGPSRPCISDCKRRSPRRD